MVDPIETPTLEPVGPESALPAPTEFLPDAFKSGEAVVLIDRKQRQFMGFLTPGSRIFLQSGHIEADALLGQLPGVRLPTKKGEIVVAYRPTLEEYVLLMKRAATIIPPKDIGYILQMADVGPGMRVVEAGIGSGGLTLSLLRAVGPQGRVISFELREDHARCAQRNVRQWREALSDWLEVRIGDVKEGLAELSGVDRVMLDLPEPWEVVGAAAQALRPGGIMLSYLPTIRQVDRLVLCIMDHKGFSHPDVAEVFLRPWVADRQRLRPSLRMVGHTGFLVRSRRRGAFLNDPVDEAHDTSSAETAPSPSDSEGETSSSG